MRYVSICSGIEAASVAWEPLGWEPVAFAEIDKFASAVLSYRFPTVPNLGDFTKIGLDDIGAVDLLVGGTPCQSFSVAGKRLGMDDPRGNLAIEFLRLAKRIGVKWILYENVSGLLSSGKGRDFGSFLGLMGECGFGWAYRILDARYFGTPQSRRRVFVVGYRGDWRPPAAVLFEPESLHGNHTTHKGSWPHVAFCITSRFGSGRNDPTAETYIVGNSGSSVRRLTPRECEKLQGFSGDHTLIPYRGKLATDAPRYRAIGNSMAIPCVRWIGERLQMVDDILKTNNRKAA